VNDAAHPAQEFPKEITSDRVLSLPDLAGVVDGVQFAGYASVYGAANPRPQTSQDEELFYWFVGTADYARRPTILWSNGGPGSSSFWGFFLENGPYEIVETPDHPILTPRTHAWNNSVNYLIFEHPLSVTLSFPADDDDLPTNVEAGIEQLYQALLNFIAKHPEIAANPLVLAGESYAGTYLPLLSKAILDGNKTPQGTSLDLRATVLLDAWVNPMVQMASDTRYALTHGLISEMQKQYLDRKFKHNLPAVNEAIQAISGAYMANIAQLGDPPFQPILDYLNRDDVRDAIHAKKGIALTDSWSAAIGKLYASRVNDSYASLVQTLLDGGLQIIVISGLNDAKDCNFMGTGDWLDLLQGDAAVRFGVAGTTQWQDGDPKHLLGYIQDGGLLSWVKVLSAGHMAVGDQPLILKLILQMTGI
jgi:cathepsin A (carboxypeptidase C)